MKTVIAVSLLMVVSACGQGPKGDTGAQGTSGLNGSGCSVSQVTDTAIAPNGGSLITCGDGTSSLVLNGATGAAGAAGKDATSTVVTPVQFCGDETSYPNTFTESGVCLGGKMYGVYSLNGGFLALLPPGTYTSNGVNSSCTFTIGDNCSVTR